jgi:type VI protein secretion system component Hcp
LKAQPAPSSHETMAVSISFQKITWTHTEGGKTASDDWSQ